MSNLIIVRHGQSQWNLENKFTGWVDVELTEKGINEARGAGITLKDFNFDIAFSSVLKRANKTLDLILDEIGQSDLEIIKDQALNERHYGDLQGKNKQEIADQFGAEQVHIWRRSYDVSPPNGESLKDTKDRVLPYFNEKILPYIKSGKDVIIAAHGNSLRALIMHLENMTPDEILQFEIPTGTPRHYIVDGELNVSKAEFLS